MNVWRAGTYVVQAPTAKRMRGLDYTKFLGKLGPDVRIVESTWQCTTPGLELSDDTILGDGRKTAIRTAGGVDGTDYVLTNHFVASDGTEDDRSFTIRVRQR